MTKSKSLDHANHNSEVCGHLYSNTIYHDWVITTAFYSSLHFILHKVFPLDIEVNKIDVTFESFETYFSFFKKKYRNKHTAITSLVETHHLNIAVDYNQLKDLCWSARYNDYNYGKEFSKQATVLLSTIEAYCS
ncbi:MAG: hypothetical protein PF574_10670 [Candidatus Delongbacteria bacterium]|jgi:hypothetical protein|nr:hypothetical protein [Candidatus Delongbacteria bacterium]